MATGAQVPRVSREMSGRMRPANLPRPTNRGSIAMPAEFQREYLVRLPLPLAQLYGRAHNAKDARARHDNTFYLFEALIKLAAAPAVAAYLDEVERGAPRVPALDRLLVCLASPSLGQWV